MKKIIKVLAALCFYCLIVIIGLLNFSKLIPTPLKTVHVISVYFLLLFTTLFVGQYFFLKKKRKTSSVKLYLLILLFSFPMVNSTLKCKECKTTYGYGEIYPISLGIPLLFIQPSHSGEPCDCYEVRYDYIKWGISYMEDMFNYKWLLISVLSIILSSAAAVFNYKYRKTNM